MTDALGDMRSRYADLAEFEREIGKLVAAGFFAKGTDIHVNRTPGRLDLMGGNDDYTGGLVFETTIREATLVAVQPRTDREVHLYNPAVRSLGWKDKIEFSLDDLIQNGRARPLEDVRTWINEDPGKAWSAYILGDLYFLIKEYPEKVKNGLALYLTSDVPLGKGVSSSAALEVASMKAMAEAYGVEAQGVRTSILDPMGGNRPYAIGLWDHGSARGRARRRRFFCPDVVPAVPAGPAGQNARGIKALGSGFRGASLRGGH